MSQRGIIFFGLALGLFLWPSVHADETEVIWSISGCAIDLAAPDTIDLGEAAPGETLTSAPNAGVVTVDSSCAYKVTLQLDGFRQDGATVAGDLLTRLLGQYAFHTEKVTPTPEVDNLQPSFVPFGSVGDVKDVCGSSAHATPPFQNHKCHLRFRVDTTLLPEGAYVAAHTLTSSAP